MDAFVWQYPKTLWKDEDGSIFFPFSQWLPAWTDPNPAWTFVMLVAIAGVVTLMWVQLLAPAPPICAD